MAGARQGKGPGRGAGKAEKPQKDPIAAKQRSQAKSAIEQSKAAKKARQKARVEARKTEGREKARLNAAKHAERQRLRDLRVKLGSGSLESAEYAATLEEAMALSAKLNMSAQPILPSKPVTRKPKRVETTPIAVNKPMTAVEKAFRDKAGVEVKSAASLHAAMFETAA